MSASQMVSWGDYDASLEGMGLQSPQYVDNLNKALNAGQSVNPPGSIVAGDGFALRVESLERTLKVLTFKADAIKLWKSIPKTPSFNTI